MTSAPAPEKPAAPLPQSSACLVRLQHASRIAASRLACAAAVLLIIVLIPLVTVAVPLPPLRPRNQGSVPSPPPAPVQPAPASRLRRLPRRTRSASPACRSSGSTLKRLVHHRPQNPRA